MKQTLLVLLVTVVGCGSGAEGGAQGNDAAGGAHSGGSAGADSGCCGSDAAGGADAGNGSTLTDVQIFQAHVEKLVSLHLEGNARFKSEVPGEQDSDAEEILSVQHDEASGQFTYVGHRESEGLVAETYIGMRFEDGKVIGIPPPDTLAPQIWTIVVKNASKDEVTYDLTVQVPAISLSTREVFTEAFSPDGQTLTRNSEVYFEDQLQGRWSATLSVKR